MKLNDDRLFCFGYGFFFALTSFVGDEHIILKSFCIVLSSLFFVFGLFLPKSLRKINAILNSFFSKVQRLVSELFIFFIFFFVFTPMAIVMRVAGRDLIGKTTDLKKNSYWVRNEDNRTKKQFFKDPF